MSGSSVTDARYVSLSTQRRDGREVRTPVWIAGVGSTQYVFTEARAGKVKRIRAQGRARLAACTAGGRVLGAWHDARARIVEDPLLIAEAYRALYAKYGWQMRLIDWFSKLTGRYDGRAIIALELT